jgi:hypothetical protein
VGRNPVVQRHPADVLRDGTAREDALKMRAAELEKKQAEPHRQTDPPALRAVT